MAEKNDNTPAEEKKDKKKTSRSAKPTTLVLKDPNAKLGLRTKKGKRANWTVEEALEKGNFKQLNKKSQLLVTGEGVGGKGVVLATDLKK